MVQFHEFFPNAITLLHMHRLGDTKRFEHLLRLRCVLTRLCISAMISFCRRIWSSHRAT
jgi:hypothetical protein